MLQLLPVVLEELARLTSVYRRPDGAKDTRQFAETYATVCASLTPEQFKGAVAAYLKSEAKYFPKPGQLLVLGGQIGRSGGATSDPYRAWDYTDLAIRGVTPCPVCGERWKTQPTGRWECWHDEAAHAKGNGYYVGRPLRDPLRRKHQPEALICFQFPGGNDD